MGLYCLKRENGKGALPIKPESLRFSNFSQYKAVKGIPLLPSAPVALSDCFQTFSSQNLAQDVIASFTLYSDVSEKAHLLDLVGTLVVNCDDTFHQQLAEEGFFQTLISDEKV